MKCNWAWIKERFSLGTMLQKGILGNSPSRRLYWQLIYNTRGLFNVLRISLASDSDTVSDWNWRTCRQNGIHSSQPFTGQLWHSCTHRYSTMNNYNENHTLFLSFSQNKNWQKGGLMSECIKVVSITAHNIGNWTDYEYKYFRMTLLWWIPFEAMWYFLGNNAIGIRKIMSCTELHE